MKNWTAEAGEVNPHLGLTSYCEGLRFEEPKKFGEGS